MPRSKKKKIQDPVLGELTFDILWSGQISIPPLGTLEVLVNGGNNGDPPTDLQRDAAASLQAAMPRLLPEIEAAIFSYYCNRRDDFLALAIEPDQEAPQLDSVKELYRVLTGPPRIFIDSHRRNESPSVKMDWNTTFDEEHGVTVEIVESVIRDVGCG
jgi:hypothetical protein